MPKNLEKLEHTMASGSQASTDFTSEPAFGLEVPQLYTGTLDDGDMLLLCTDGFYKKAPPDFFRICLYEEREAGQLYRRLKGIGRFLTAQGEKDNMKAVLIGYEKEESVWKKNEKSVKNTF